MQRCGLRHTAVALVLALWTPAARGELPELRAVPLRLRLVGEAVRMPGEPSMGLFGLHYAAQLVEGRAELGLGGYGAITGRRGGLFVLGISGATRPLIHGPLLLELGGFLGGGGGANAPQGGGLMVRPHLALELRWRAYGARAEVAHVRFPTGAIASTHLALGVSVPDELLLIVGSQQNVESVTSSSRSRVSAPFALYVPAKEARRRSGALLSSPISLIGIRFDRFLSEFAYITASAHGALGGTVAGYMDVFGGSGLALRSGRWEAHGQLLAGAGGGGDVDTAGGLLLKPELGASVRLGRPVRVGVDFGRIVSAAAFSAWTVAAHLSWETVPVRSAGGGAPLSSIESDAWRLGGKLKTYFPTAHSRMLSPRRLAPILGLFGAALEKPLATWASMTGEGYGAFYGGAGGYAEGLWGVRASWPIHEPLGLFGEVQVGAAGGGGLRTGSGLIAAASAGAQFGRSPALSLAVGRTVAPEGTFAATALTIGISGQLERAIAAID